MLLQYSSIYHSLFYTIIVIHIMFIDVPNSTLIFIITTLYNFMSFKKNKRGGEQVYNYRSLY